MKQPTLLVEGIRHAVINIEFFGGEIEAAAIMRNGVYERYCGVNSKDGIYTEQQLRIDLKECLQFDNSELVEFLESKVEQQGKVVDAFAVDSLDKAVTVLELEDKRIEYKLMQKKLFGFIDAVEEVRAFLEGYYSKGGEVNE